MAVPQARLRCARRGCNKWRTVEGLFLHGSEQLQQEANNSEADLAPQHRKVKEKSDRKVGDAGNANCKQHAESQ